MRTCIQKLRSLLADRFVFFAVLILAGCVFTLVYLVLNGNTSQVYTDIVNGYLTRYGSNISADHSLFYILSFLGAILYGIYFLSTKQAARIGAAGLERAPEKRSDLELIIGILVLSGTCYLIYTLTHPLIIFCFLLLLLLSAVDRSASPLGLVFLCLGAYAVIGLYRLYIYLGGAAAQLKQTTDPEQLADILAATAVSPDAVIVPAFALAVFFALRRDRRTLFVRGILVAQCFLPFLLLIYLASDYLYNNYYTKIDPPPKAILLICLFIAAFLIEDVLLLRRHWSSCADWRGIISLGSCTCILAFNRFSGSGVIFNSDLHHPFEDTITYSQVVHQGQKLFSEFYPPSGLYAFFNGFFLDFFGGGLIENMALSQNLFYLFIALLLVVLLSLHVNRAYLLGFALLFSIFDYNRFAFILPIILLLSCPQLLRRKNLWLQAWFLTSYLHGLYYPVYGAALALGFLPLGLYQLYCFVKCGDLKREIRRPLFWLGWGLCLAPVLWGIPLLLGLLRHTLAMGGQTLYADGNARFGQVVPGGFFPYIQNISLRLILYCLFSFIVLPAAVWLCAALGLRLGKVRFTSGRLTAEQPVPALLSFAGGIALLVSFSFTTVVLDENNLYSRSRGMLFAVAVFLIVLAVRCLPKGRSWYLLFGICIFFLVVTRDIGFFKMGSAGKLSACYTVPEGYVYTYDDPVQKWGHAFVPADTYDSVQESYEKAQTLDREKTYYNVFPTFGYYYLLDVKGAAAIENWTVRGFSATKENVETILRNKSIVGQVDPIDNYYLYHWLLTSGEYVWDPENEYFLPNDAGLPREQVLEKNKAAAFREDTADRGRIACTWGASFDSLQSIFTQEDSSYTLSTQDMQATIDFDLPLDGTDADFLYLDFSIEDPTCCHVLHSWYDFNVQKNDRFANLFMKRLDNPELRVIVKWDGEDGSPCSMVCNMGNGKLLIPLGSGKDWLLQQHDKITIEVTYNGKQALVPDLKDLQFLNVREIGSENT